MKKRLIKMSIIILGILLMAPAIVLQPFSYVLFNIDLMDKVGFMLYYGSFKTTTNA